MILTAGIDYTVDASGHYVFPAALAGQLVTIQYQAASAVPGQSALTQLGLFLVPGYAGQPTWGYLTTNYPSQAIGYSGLAYVGAAAYDLGSDATVVNHSFEITTPFAVTAAGDANPATVAQDILTNPRYGANFPSSRVASIAAWANYALAANLVMSPVLDQQKPAADWLKYLLQLSNTDVTWSQGQLKFVPLGDAACTANGATFTPSTTPAYDLTEDHFLTADSHADPVTVDRKANDDVYNHIRVEYCNRANEYNTEPLEVKDAADIDRRGLRTKDTIEAHAICAAAVAQAFATLQLQRELGVRNTYKFTLPWTFALLEPLDLVTLTDSYLGLNRTPVRINKISEADNGNFDIEAEDCPIGIASAPVYGAQAGTGFAHNYNDPAPSVLTPTIFEAPIERTTTGLEVYAAVTGPATGNWGGCTVWASFDGSNYKQVTRLFGGSRYGTITGAIGTSDTSVGVQLRGQGGQLLSGSATDAASLATLCWINGGSDGGEYVSHQGATLTGANAYTLAGLVRGAFDTTVQAHSLGAEFVRIDDAVAKSGPLDLGLIGSTIFFKFTSFNVYGGGEQDISTVTAYQYTITGAMQKLPPANFDYFHLDIQPDGTRQFTFAYVSSEQPVDFMGAQIRYVEGTVASPNWDSMKRFDDLPDKGYYSQSPVETNMLLAGTYTFALRALDKTRNPSRTSLLIEATLPDRRKGNTLAEWQENTEGWTGTKTSCHVDTASGALEADDATTTWSSLTSWSSWANWSLHAASPIVYTAPVRDLGTSLPTQIDSTIDADGTVLVEMRTSNDNVTWSSWGSASPPFNARYVQVRATVTATGGAPVPTIRTWRYSVTANLKSESIENLDITTLTGSYRIGVGDVRIPLHNTYVVLKSPSVVIQDSTAASWTWVLIDKNVSPGPRVQFRKNGVLADPALVDFEVEGI
jgi:hypothetical protein